MRPHRALIVRRLLIVSFVLLAVTVWFSYYRRTSRREEAVRQPQILGSEVTSATESIEYTEHRQGRDLFHVRARRYIETRGGKNILEGVEARNFGKDGRRRDTIRSDFCEYDQNTNLVFFSGRVIVKTTEGTEIFTEALSYSKATETAATDKNFTLKRAGLEGSGTGLKYNFSTQDFAVEKESNFLLDPDTRIRSDRADFTRSRQLLSLKGRAHIVRTSSALTADEADALISIDEHVLRTLEARGSCVYTAETANGSVVIKGQRVRLFFVGKENRVSELQAFNQASLEMERKGQRSLLAAPEIALSFEPESGNLSAIRGAGGARFAFEQQRQATAISGQRLTAELHEDVVRRVLAQGKAELLVSELSKDVNRLSAESIDLTLAPAEQTVALKELNARGQVAWALPSTRSEKSGDGSTGSAAEMARRELYAQLLRVVYQPDGTNPERLEARGDCRLQISPKVKSAASIKRTILGEQLEVNFHAGSSEIARFSAQGRVRVESRSEANLTITSSDKLRATIDPDSQDIDSFEQMGNFRYLKQGQMAESEGAKYDGRAGVLEIFGKPVLKDEQTTTYAERMVLDDANNKLAATGGVRTIHRGGKQGQRLGPFAAREGAPILITAASLELDQEAKRAVYTGSARTVQQGNAVQADIIEVYEREGEFRASGRVQSLYYQKGEKGDQAKRAIRISAQSMIYRQASNSARYEREAKVETSDMLVYADLVQVFFEGQEQQLKRMLAEGGVRMLQPDKEGRGERAEYYPEEEKMILWGNLAQITNKKGGRSEGRQLTFYSKDDRILLDK